MGEDEVDVVAVVGVVDGDVFRSAGGEGDVAEDAVAAEADGRDVVLCEDEVARVGKEGGDVLFLFAGDAFQAKQVAVHVFAVQAVRFAHQVFFVVCLDKRQDAAAAARFGVFVFFEDEDVAAAGDDEAVAVGVVGA